jgi:cyclopropane fatty-acyl-phospholipid synthase-like methyltransferase
VKNTIESMRDWRTYWDHAVELAGTGDLFQQVGRTIGGKSEPEEQVEIHVKSIANLLKLNKNDVLLDLCCGNGIVTVRLAPLCGTVIGIDYSDELIQVARKTNTASNVTYIHSSVEDMPDLDLPTTGPTKICMNAGLQYFTEPMVEKLFASLRRLARGDLELLFTAVPDADKLDRFYNTPERRAEYERRSAAGNEAIGTWWNRGHLASIFQEAGYDARAIDLDPTLTSAHYRFDLLAHLSVERKLS